MGKRIKKYLLICINCLILLLSGNFAYSQSIIYGTVTDSLYKPVPYVNVFLKAANQGGIIAFTTSAENGSYKISTEKEGNFELVFSSISFKKKSVPISLEKYKNYNQDVVLKAETFTLNEVIVNTDKAITVKGDTIIFKADAFKKGTEETVEDLLKNIPGITVESDGKIKIGGKEIEKVMVEGDDLFEKGYKMLTKNLDASVINKIEVYEHYSNNRLLKGIEDSDRIALNLTLKNSVKSKLFGTLKPSYGLASENRYDASATLISFRETNKLYGFANFNNIGLETTSAISELMEAGENLTISEKEQQAISFIKLINNKPDVGVERTNFNNAEMASLNNIYSISPKIKLKTIGFLNWDENDFFRKSLDTYFLPTGNFTNTENYSLYGKTFSGFANTQLTYDRSKTETVEYAGKYSGNRSSTKTFLDFNAVTSSEQLHEDPFAIDQKIKYTNKVKANQALLIIAHYAHANNPQHYTNSRFLFNELFKNENQITGISQKNNHSLSTLGFDASLYTKRTNHDLWQAKVGLDYSNNKYTSSFKLMGIGEKPEAFQNNTKYKLSNLFFEPSYRLKMGSLALTGTIYFTQYFNRLKLENKTLESSPLFINPKITAEWQLNQTNRLFSFFKYESKNPTLPNVQDGYVLTQYNRFSKGLQNIEPLKSSTFFVNYTLSTILSAIYANTSFIYVKEQDYLGSNSLITPNYSLNELVRLKNKEFLNLQTDANIFLQSMVTNAKIKLGYTIQNFENIVNGNFRNVNVSTFNYGGEVRSAFTIPFNFHIGTEWFNSTYKTNVAQENSRNRSFLDLIYRPAENLAFSFNTSRYYFSGLNQDNDTYYFIDFESKYQVIKNRFSLSLVGKNLLNTKTYNEITVDDTGIFKSEYKLLPRFFLLKASIRI